VLGLSNEMRLKTLSNNPKAKRRLRKQMEKQEAEE
jgi:hypothetical protein